MVPAEVLFGAVSTEAFLQSVREGVKASEPFPQPPSTPRTLLTPMPCAPASHPSSIALCLRISVGGDEAMVSDKRALVLKMVTETQISALQKRFGLKGWRGWILAHRVFTDHTHNEDISLRIHAASSVPMHAAGLIPKGK